MSELTLFVVQSSPRVLLLISDSSPSVEPAAAAATLKRKHKNNCASCVYFCKCRNLIYLKAVLGSNLVYPKINLFSKFLNLFWPPELVFIFRNSPGTKVFYICYLNFRIYFKHLTKQSHLKVP